MCYLGSAALDARDEHWCFSVWQARNSFVKEFGNMGHATDPQTGDIVLPDKPANWDEFFAALEGAGIPSDLLSAEERQ
jgi:hypothetical protein